LIGALVRWAFALTWLRKKCLQNGNFHYRIKVTPKKASRSIKNESAKPQVMPTTNASFMGMNGYLSKPIQLNRF
jgi:hypothetical protein